MFLKASIISAKKKIILNCFPAPRNKICYPWRSPGSLMENKRDLNLSTKGSRSTTAVSVGLFFEIFLKWWVHIVFSQFNALYCYTLYFVFLDYILSLTVKDFLLHWQEAFINSNSTYILKDWFPLFSWSNCIWTPNNKSIWIYTKVFSIARFQGNSSD